MGSFFDILRQQYSQNGSLGVGTRSEVHPRLFWLACSLINLGTFLLFLKEKLTIQALMITTAHDRPFPEFPSIMNDPRNGWVHLAKLRVLCPPYATSTTTTRRRTAATTASSPVCVWHGSQGRWTVDGGESGGECAGCFVRGCTWLPDLCAVARGSKTERLR